MHCSWPEGRQFLIWLAQRPDGTATGDGYQAATAKMGRQRLHVNNGACNARYVLGELGVADPESAVVWTDLGRTPENTMVSEYRLRSDVLAGMRRVEGRGLLDYLGSRALARKRWAELRAAFEVPKAPMAVGSAAGGSVQTTLLPAKPGVSVGQAKPALGVGAARGG